MIKDLKNEMNSFVEALENSNKDEKELKNLKEKTAHLFETFADELESVFKYKEDEIKRLEERQKQADDKLDEMDSIIKNITRDIYDEYEDFEIICPYCNYEFDSDVDETVSEVICPECQNMIELDWGLDVDDNSSCTGNCSGCNECNEDNEN